MDMLKSVFGGGDKNDLMSIVMGLIGGERGRLSGLVG